MKFSKTWLSLTLVSTTCFVVVLVIYAYTGSLMGYYADDYCIASIFNEVGFVAAQLDHYSSWSGRFTYSFVVNLTEFGGVKLISILPSLTITTWFICLTWTISQWLALSSIPHRRLVAIFLASLILFSTLEGTPDIVESLYWRTGVITYTLPLVFFTGFAGIVGYHLRHKQVQSVTWSWLAFSFLVTFFAGGFSETYMVVQTGALGVAILLLLAGVFPLVNRRSILLLLLAGLGGSLLSVAVVVAAPGNQLRQSYFAPPADWFTIIRLTAILIGSFLKKAMWNSSSGILLSVLLPFLLSLWAAGLRLDYKRALWLLDGLAVITLGVLLSCFAPAIYAMGLPLPERAHVIPQFILICSLVGVGFILGILVKQVAIINQFSSTFLFALVSLAVILGVLWLGPVRTIQNKLDLAVRTRVIAAIRDQRDAQIRQAQSEGITDLTLPSLPNSGAFQDDISSDPTYWINRCAARYYGLQSIAAQ